MTANKTLVDPVLGKLVFTHALDGMNEYETTVKIGSRRVKFILYTDGKFDLRPCVARAKKIVLGYSALEKKIHKYVADNIYPTYNLDWRAERKPFALEQVLSKLKLSMVFTQPEPRAIFSFDVGELFDGHCLELEMGERNKFLAHDMPG